MYSNGHGFYTLCWKSPYEDPLIITNRMCMDRENNIMYSYGCRKIYNFEVDFYIVYLRNLHNVFTKYTKIVQKS